MWRNFSTWQIFSTFLMWRNFPLDRFVSTFLMWRNFSMWQSFPTFIIWRIFPLDMSWGEFLHMANFFSTGGVCGVCDKYQVCIFVTYLLPKQIGLKEKCCSSIIPILNALLIMQDRESGKSHNSMEKYEIYKKRNGMNLNIHFSVCSDSPQYLDAQLNLGMHYLRRCPPDWATGKVRFGTYWLLLLYFLCIFSF